MRTSLSPSPTILPSRNSAAASITPELGRAQCPIRHRISEGTSFPSSVAPRRNRRWATSFTKDFRRRTWRPSSRARPAQRCPRRDAHRMSRSLPWASERGDRHLGINLTRLSSRVAASAVLSSALPTTVVCDESGVTPTLNLATQQHFYWGFHVFQMPSWVRATGRQTHSPARETVVTSVTLPVPSRRRPSGQKLT